MSNAAFDSLERGGVTGWTGARSQWMDRCRRLHDLWGWLIPFRVVAETESLQAASELLHVAPSALSRSVHLLEDRLGIELFDRRSNRLVLNAAGRRLLAAIRTGMRGIDDAVTEIVGAGGAPALRVACPGELLPVVLRVIPGLATELGYRQIAVDEVDDDDVVAAVIRGSIDLAVVATPVGDDAVVVRSIGGVARAVFVARPPAGAVVAGELGFAVRVDRVGRPRDGVAADHPRLIAMRAATGAVVVEAVRAGGLAAVLPVAAGRAAGLVAIDAGIAPPPLELAMVCRPPIAGGGAYEAIGERLASVLRAL